MELVNEGKDRVLIPEGTYSARCIRIIDLGTQVHPKYGPKRKVNLAFELDEEDDEGNPFVAYRNFTASITPKSHLAKAIKSWTGQTIKKGERFDLDSLLNEPCLVTIVHSEPNDDDEVYANIDSITKLPKSMKPFEPENEAFSLYLDETFNRKQFNDLPEWLQEKIEATEEYKALSGKGSKKKKKAVEEDEEEDEQPKRRSRKSAKVEEPEEDEEEVEEEEEEEEDDMPRRKRRAAVEDDEEEEEQPRRRKRKAVEEEEEEEEQPRRRRRR